MNVKKTIKKIAAIAIGTAMLGSTMLSASATLEQFPAPFVANGMANVQLVIGSGSTDDYLGALDIATSLQAASVSSVAVAGTSTTTVEGGVQLDGGNGDYLIYGESTAGQADLDLEDLPTLLADGNVKDEDGKDSSNVDLATEDSDYTQKLDLGAMSVKFGTPENEKTPLVYLDQLSGAAYTISVEFDDAMDLEALEDGETIKIAGKPFTFSKDSTADQLVLFGADQTTYLELNTPKTITSEGKSYTVEIVGANSESDGGETIILDVNGVRKTLTEDETTTVNGLDVYIKDLFVTNIPTLSASANIFVGSDEVKLTDGDLVNVNGNDLDGYEFNIVDGTDFQNVTKMSFVFTPSDLDDDKDHYLTVAEDMKDPLFETFKLSFASQSLELKDSAKVPVSIDVVGDNKVTVSALNDNGKTIKIDYLEDGAIASDFETDAIIDEDDYFLGLDGDVTTLFQVSSVKSDSTEATIKNIVTGESKVVKVSDAVKGSAYTISAIDGTAGSETVTLNTAAIKTISLKGGATITLNNATAVTINESSADFEDVSDIGTLVANFVWDSTAEEYTITDATTGFVTDSDDDGVTYGLSDYGTFYTLDDDNVKLAIYTPDEAEVEYNVFVAPTMATVSTTASGTTTDKVNPIAVGVAVRDADVNIANPSKNLIVIGGTCINSVSAKLKNVAANTCGEASGLKPGEATIELFTLDNGKVAMLVAGWEAVDTQAAARAVATKAPGLTGNKVTLSVTSANQYTIKQ